MGNGVLDQRGDSVGAMLCSLHSNSAFLCPGAILRALNSPEFGEGHERNVFPNNLPNSI